MGYPGKGVSPFDNGDNGEDETPEGFPDFGGEKGMKSLFDSFMPASPRRESDPNRKVGKNELYGRYTAPPPSMDGMG